MEINFVEEVIRHPHYTNYDYKKYEVTEGKRKSVIFEHNGSYITLKTNKFYDSLEDAASAIMK